MLRQVGGLHVQSYQAPMGAQAFDATVNRKAGSFKFMNDANNPEAVQRFHNNNPTAPVCYRRHTDDKIANIDAYTNSAISEVAQYGYLKQAGLLYVEIPINEAYQTGDELSRLAEASIPQARKIRDAGCKPVAFNFSVGNPPRIMGADVNGEIVNTNSDIARIADAAQAVCHECGGAIGYHNYDLPDSWLNTWLGLRYRRMHTELRDLHGVTARWWLGESGVDRGIIAGNLGGWRCEEFHLSSADYTHMVRSSCQEISKDDYVVGMSFFGAGGYEEWLSFEYVDCPDVLGVFSELYEVEVNPVPPPIGQGFQRMIPYLGQPIESEVYHYAGQDGETSMAVFQNGSAMWTRKSNETVGVRSDGTVFSDLGNRGDGRTVHQIYPGGA